MRIFLGSLLCLLVGWPATAQKYLTALGVRLGQTNYGLTLQQRLLPQSTLEVLGTINPREARATALFEQHSRLIGRRVNFYGGAGAHLGTLKDFGAFTGFDAIVGIEYKLHIFPLVVSADFKPGVHFGHEDWFDLGAAVSVRYVLVAEPRPQRAGRLRDQLDALFGGDPDRIEARRQARAERRKVREREKRRQAREERREARQRARRVRRNPPPPRPSLWERLRPSPAAPEQ